MQTIAPLPRSIEAHCRDAGITLQRGEARPGGEVLEDLPANVRSRIEVRGGHWIWIGAIQFQGYGFFNGHGRSWLAHRLVWVLLGGQVPENLHHECATKSCVRPSHLEPCSVSDHAYAHWAARRRTHCPNGHEYTVENTHWRSHPTRRATRECRQCKADQVKRYRERSSAKKKAQGLQRDAEARRRRNGWEKKQGSRY